MATMREHSERSAHVAPLHIHRGHYSESSVDMSSNSGTVRHNDNASEYSGYSCTQITPPATPSAYDDDVTMTEMDYPRPVFHNYLRAVYPFNRAESPLEPAVTLHLDKGDVVLVYSIHTNGWADGTLLLDGERGWVPTNFCENYEPEEMRSLLRALISFSDLMKSGITADDEIFSNQEFIKGIIAGVRLLLERLNCLTRDSPFVLSNDIVRRSRRSLLSDVSSLVKTSKHLQAYREHMFTMTEPENISQGIIDEMLLKAFKIVTRGVRFHDACLADMESQYTLNRITSLTRELYDPSTPPADATTFQNAMSRASAGSRRESRRVSTGAASREQAAEEQTKRQSFKRSSSVFSPTTRNSRRQSSMQLSRQSLSHRLSTAGQHHDARRQNYVSGLLGSTHETFISCLGSLVGRLHLANGSNDLLISIRQAIAAGKALGTIIELLCARDVRGEAALQDVRDTMYQCINQLVIAARECVRPSSSDGEDNVILQKDHDSIESAATGCVVAVGECVDRAKSVIEIVGDFEPELSALGIDVSAFAADVATDNNPRIIEESTLEEPASLPPPPPTGFDFEKTLPPSVADMEKPLPSFVIIDQEKPLPLVPESEAETSDDAQMGLIGTAKTTLAPSPTFLPALRLEGLMGGLQLQTSIPSNDLLSSRSDSVATCTGSPSTYMSSLRGSEASLVSQTSTRATTPELSCYRQSHQSHQVSKSINSISESQATSADEREDDESRVLEKTFAHELIFNKERQVTGGSLPALVERLTSHDSTPDATFVSTFYLTFRLFATPITFSEALIERFNYVNDSVHIAAPVRLRVYNVFKGWLETHWQHTADEVALPIIRSFAETTLLSVLPQAGRRLSELAEKVAAIEGPITPRLISSIGKTSTSIAQYISPDTPLPAPILSKSQINSLKTWKMGGTSPSILDFSPVEMARQLTIKEMNVFCTIMPEELLASEWMKKSGSNAVNVKAMSTLSTDLSNLVADTVLQSESDAKKRAVIIKHWIKIANECLILNNYDSLMAIICSINSSMITRLKKTWDMISPKRKEMLKVLQDIVEPTKNHAVLRQRLQGHVPPCLPFVGTYLTDLTFVDMGNPATKQLTGTAGEKGMAVINFDKHTRTAKIIGDLQRFQIPYRLAEVPELQEWIQAQVIRVRASNDSNNVQQYYRKSLLLEPRMTQKTSPVDFQGAFAAHPTPILTKEKFDLFSWAHTRDKLALTPTPTNS
ncbi:hypothetical protein V499_02534 [Pseudogymnoascus sp. VKM F-103]|uniref:Ras guanine nucleotide exchange factor n=1 Tax=Pseudogymnoascus verrucosus TaxID=342668 RepID=A0A1B8GLU8_9PEZI|nr:uncharacterized protein VE01_04182 [Pseudogymnoascus verrucosus]KFY78258.1 hypothetical protein V499_02534 [Pseudogymnoascus sp. VKM F-103]OBT96768.1 hypothetical protein VE01_04182 [Pseudogymnoascus verrucosus]